MGRPSKLSDKQWDTIRKRMLEGEKPADLAREYGVSKTAISNRVSKRADAVRTVANQIVTAERALGELSVSEQLQAVSLASKLRSISDSLATAADLGAKTAMRLNALANSEVAKVDDADPLASIASLRSVGVLTKLANDSASIAVNLLAANKDRVREGEKPDVPAGLEHFYGQPG